MRVGAAVEGRGACNGHGHEHGLPFGQKRRHGPTEPATTVRVQPQKEKSRMAAEAEEEEAGS